jgi:hypothetical protein
MDKLTDVLFTVAICVAFATMMWTNNKRFEILECRIDLLNGLEITRPECLDELMGPAKERKAQPEKKPTKQT